MKRPCIVAEISANHLGQYVRALALIDAAKEAGADAIKLQLYDPDKMAPSDLMIESGPWAGRNARELYREAMTPREWFLPLFEHAMRRGIEAFSSVFDVDGLAFLESLGCPRYKIASFEILDLPLIRAVSATGKPMIISTGMAAFYEIGEAVTAARWCQDLTLLKCTSAYPASPADANLAAGPALAGAGYTFGRIANSTKWGLSDHTLGLSVPVVATVLGATMIEKHLTISRSDGGPDAAFSSEPHEFAAMVKACREAAQAIGEVRYGPTESERPQLQLRGRTLGR
jgi:pseudaminic acid synthase